MNSFSAKNRSEIIERLSTSEFDLLVIGGGITGAGIALDASARGLKVALIEMQDFASGTSGRSTKLIHGGLRYLKQGEFRLVAEVGKERKIIHSNAPHLARPEKMLLPIVRNGSLGKFTSRFGMWMYEWLAGVKKSERHKVLSKEETLIAEPLLQKENLLGGILFYEYRTDDARLTIEVIKEAVSRDAIAINYMKVTGFVYTNEKITGVKIEDQLDQCVHEIRAKYVVNACGPWVDAMDDCDQKMNRHKLEITKGVHIVVDAKKLPVKQSVYFDTNDKRMIFVIPREEKIYIGTTDTFYSGDLQDPKVSVEDKNYLLNCVNQFFPENKLHLSDIESFWAGLRPLINKPGKGPSEISRKDELFTYPSGLITIAGGKLTGYRKMAQRVVNKVADKIARDTKKNIPTSSTNQLKLSGGKIENTTYFSEFVQNKIASGVAVGLEPEISKMLANRYGSNVDELFKICEHLNKTETHILPVSLRTQIIYAIEYEMCLTPSDFLIRRSGLLYFDIETVKKWNVEICEYMQSILNLENNNSEQFKNEFQAALDERMAH